MFQAFLYVTCSHQDLEKAVAKDIEHALPALIRARSSMKVGIPRIVDQLLALPEMLQVGQLLTRSGGLDPLPIMTWL